MVDSDTIAESAMAKAYVCIKYGTVLVYVATWLSWNRRQRFQNRFLLARSHRTAQGVWEHPIQMGA